MTGRSSSIDPNRQYLAHEEVSRFVESAMSNIDELQHYQNDDELETDDDIICTLENIEIFALGVAYDARDAIEAILDQNGYRETVQHCVNAVLANNDEANWNALAIALSDAGASNRKLPKDLARNLASLGMPMRRRGRSVNTFGRAVIESSSIKWWARRISAPSPVDPIA